MNNFKFRLQKLLDIRNDKEEESRRIFKEAQLEKERAEEKFKTLKESYKRYKEFSPDESLVEQKIKHIYLNALTNSIAEAELELQDKIKKLEEKREQLKMRQIERKTVEILKDKQFQVFLKEQNSIEQKVNDEFALYGFLRAHEGR
ncbi:flagellar export protein FliJ [Clostridium sp. SYSU_GA19001]|uniref:flagellar export protein FliJ n=1 Tax=Clostridium caldaquaticum TaxID=2940653 RepID=UPI0020772D90|nr:flagellar export protein FliJ [Clostridium caldaquaticum]MCM8710973.1 flagellar export protein FliJ [Clostridium caldaquaticum]